jgi:hypothetical protein
VSSGLVNDMTRLEYLSDDVLQVLFQVEALRSHGRERDPTGQVEISYYLRKKRDSRGKYHTQVE